MSHSAWWVPLLHFATRLVHRTPAPIDRPVKRLVTEVLETGERLKTADQPQTLEQLERMVADRIEIYSGSWYARTRRRLISDANDPRTFNWGEGQGLKGNTSAEELADETLSKIVERVERGEDLPSYAYLRTTLYHIAVDITRKAARVVSEGPDGALPRGAVQTDDPSQRQEDRDGAVAAIRAGLKALRELVDGLEFTKKQVRYLQVFLFRARMGLAALIGPEYYKRRPLASFCREVFPWHQEEEELGFRKRWPEIAPLWDACSDDLERSAELPVGALSQRVADCSDGRAVLTGDRWYQWVRRAKKEARGQLSESEWSQLLARLFPDHNPKVEGGQ